MKSTLTYLLLAVSVLTAQPRTIVFGSGCFWGAEKHFESLDGVIGARAGYAGGNFPEPTYEKVLANRHPAPGVVNYAEVVEVRYDDDRISDRALIESFWEMHDPTQGDRQGNDIGNNYRSVLYYTTEQQKRIALQTRAAFQQRLSEAGYGRITTEIGPLKRFYPAEAYHQDYLAKHPGGYCPNHATGVTFDRARKAKETAAPAGREIVVVTAPYCPFCEKFDRDVLRGYRGTVPLRTVAAGELKELGIDTGVAGTPTVLFLEDGEVVFTHTGYMDEKTFYRALEIRYRSSKK